MFSLKPTKVLLKTIQPIISTRNIAKITSIHAITSTKTTPPSIQHSATEKNKRKLLLERPGLFAIKRGMITWFTESGSSFAATVLEVDSCEVISCKTSEEYGYDSVLVGAIDKLKNSKFESNLSKFDKAGVSPKYKIGEFRVQNAKDLIQNGTELTADYFAVGQKVDIKGITKGKGFAGVMKRWGFSGGRKTHGVTKAHRTPGAMGGNQNPGRVLPGKKMAGRMGGHKQTTFGLEVLYTDKEAGVLIVKGNIPGPKKGIVRVSDALYIYGDRLSRMEKANQ